MGIGEIMAAAAAACWATSSIVYGRTLLTAATINFAKNLFGAGLVWLHLVCLWLFWGQGFLHFSGVAWLSLVLSGLIGIALGDTCYFRSLQILGPRRSLVVATTTPVFGGLLGWLILGETLSVFSIVGILVSAGGIAMVVMDKQSRRESPGHYPGTDLAGVGLGLVAAMCQAAGGAISKIGMRECTPLEATLVRLLAAAVFGIVFFRLAGKLAGTSGKIATPKNLSRLLPAAALGTWLGIWFSQIGFKHSSVAIASMLMTTSPLFAIPLVWFFDGHRISGFSILGTLVALAGIGMALSF